MFRALVNICGCYQKGSNERVKPSPNVDTPIPWEPTLSCLCFLVPEISSLLLPARLPATVGSISPHPTPTPSLCCLVLLHSIEKGDQGSDLTQENGGGEDRSGWGDWQEGVQKLKVELHLCLARNLESFQGVVFVCWVCGVGAGDCSKQKRREKN